MGVKPNIVAKGRLFSKISPRGVLRRPSLIRVSLYVGVSCSGFWAYAGILIVEPFMDWR